MRSRSPAMMLLPAFVAVSAIPSVAGPTDALFLRQSLVGTAYVVQVQGARKGTRNYVPDAGTLTVPNESVIGQESSTLDECMATWDAGTHITKGKWREICERQIRDRNAHSGPATQAEP